MKKILIASSALVAAAGSASALDVSLNGNIKIAADISLADSGFDNPSWDAGFTLKASGESMGWTYGGTIKMDMVDTKPDGQTSSSDMNLIVDSAAMYMGGDFMGKISVKDSCGNFVNAVDSAAGMDAADEVGSISGHCLEWTGLSFAGLELKAAFDLDKGNDDIILGAEYLNPSLGLFRIEYDVEREHWDAEVGTKLGDTTIAIGMDYNNNEDSGDGDYDYVITASGSLGDLTYAIAYSPDAAGSNDNPDYTDASGLADSVDGYDFDLMAPATRLGSGDGGKAMGVKLGYDCFSATFGLDLEQKTDATYDALGLTGAEEQGILNSWELGADCAIHDGVKLTATVGAESARAAAIAAATATSPLQNDATSNIHGSVGATITF